MSVLLQESSVYKYSGTALDTRENLDVVTEGKLLDVSVSVAQVAGQMALQLVHDHILSLDVDEYTRIIRKNMMKIVKEIRRVRFFSPLPMKCVFVMRCESSFSLSRGDFLLFFPQVAALIPNASLTLKDSWLNSAIGSYSRAALALHNEIRNSDTDVEETCRKINDRIMRVKLTGQSHASMCETLARVGC